MKTAADITCSFLQAITSAIDDYAGFSFVVNTKPASPNEIIVLTDDTANTIVSQRELRGGDQADRNAVQVLLRCPDQPVATALGMKLMSLVDSFPTLTKEQRTVTIPQDGHPDVDSEQDLDEEVQIVNLQRFTGVGVVQNPETSMYECYFSIRVTV